MAETYDSVLDRIGEFNLVTEHLAKARATDVQCQVAGRADCWLHLTKTADNYRVEVPLAAVKDAPSLEKMGFKVAGDVYARDVRRSERSWNIASQLEDILQDILQLPSDVSITVTTTLG